MLRIGRRLEFAALLTAQGELITHSDDAVVASREALGSQLRLHAQRTIRLAALSVHRLAGHLQACVCVGTLRWLAIGPRVEAAGRHAKGSAKDGNPTFENAQGLLAVSRSAFASLLSFCLPTKACSMA